MQTRVRLQTRPCRHRYIRRLGGVVILRGLIRVLTRRWKTAAVTGAAVLILAFVFVPGMPFVFTARARVTLTPPSPSLVQLARSDRLASDSVRPGVTEEGPALIFTVTGPSPGRAVGRANAAAKAFRTRAEEAAVEETAQARRRADRALAEIDAEEKRIASRLADTPAEESAVAGMLQEHERELGRLRAERTALKARADRLAGRVREGASSPPDPVDTTGSDRLDADLREALLGLAERRARLPEGDPELREQEARVEALRRERDEAARREVLAARFGPLRRAIDEARRSAARSEELTRREDDLAPQIERLRARLAELRAARSGGEPDRRTLEARRDALERSRREVEAERVRLAATAAPVLRLDPAATADLSGMAAVWALLAALVLAAGAAWTAEASTTRVRTGHDVRRCANLPLMGIVPLERDEEERLLHRSGERTPMAEVFNTVATLVERSDAWKVLTVAGAGPGEGKSTVACNLAVTLARAGATVLLVDADLRRPTQHHLFSTVSEPGLSSYLVGQTDEFDSTMAATAVENLFLVPSGPLLEAPMPYLRSERFRALLPELRERFDHVIFDVPPVRAAADALQIAPRTDGVLLVLSAEDTHKDDVSAAKRLLRAAGARIAGCVLNKATVRSREYDVYEPAAAVAAHELADDAPAPEPEA